MNTATTLSGLVLSLLASCSPLRKQRVFVSPEEQMKYASAEMSSVPEGSPDVLYHLFDDPVRTEALRRFCELSKQPGDYKDNPLDYVVVLQAYSPDSDQPFLWAHGYLLDDCGLVLTIYHTWCNAPSDGFFTVLDKQGREYRAQGTDIFDIASDFAVLAAETNKPPQTHPLRFPSAIFPLEATPLCFSTYFTLPWVDLERSKLDCNTFLRLELSSLLASFGHHIMLPPFPPAYYSLLSPSTLRGNVLSSEQCLSTLVAAGANVDEISSDIEHLLQCGRFTFSQTVRSGYSGTPVFGDDGTFWGLVWGFFKEGHSPGAMLPYEGVGIVSSAYGVLDKLEQKVSGEHQKLSEVSSGADKERFKKE